jgi:PAS domain S-box-containing protein
MENQTATIEKGNGADRPNLNIDSVTSKVKELAFDALFKNLPVAFYWMDRNGYFLGGNDIEVALLGLPSLNDLIGKHSDEVCTPVAWQGSKQVMETDQVMTLEESHIKPDGEKVYYLSIKCPIHNAYNKVIGLLGLSIDITERKKMEEELRIAKEKAEAASRAKTQFLATTSHELRIPLTGVLGLTGFLKAGDVTAEEQKQYISHIDGCATHLLSIVNDILDFSKLEAEKFELTTSPIDLKAIIEETAMLLTASAKIKNLDLLVCYEPNTPNNILADSRAIRQILTNLVGNAIKFTEHGHVAIKVRCLIQDSITAKLEIVVEDTGKGIPADKLDAVFERFYQVQDAYVRNDARNGTGLGLSITKKLVDLMNGTIHATSQVDKGTQFTLAVEFPLQSNAITELPWAPYAANVKVLIVHDNAARAEVLCKHLGTANCFTTNSNKAADEILSAQQMAQPYDVIIVDQQIQYISPADLLRILKQSKKLHKFMPILLMTSGTRMEKQLAQADGFFETIVKPVQPIAFQTALTSAWERWTELHEKTGAGTKVLLVEDDPIVQLVHKKMLGNLGYQVDIAENGEKTIMMAKKGYALIFIDIGLPDMNGFDLIKTLRAQEDRNRKAALIALTGHTGDSEKQICLDAGADEVASKPIREQELQQILERYLQ